MRDGSGAAAGGRESELVPIHERGGPRLMMVVPATGSQDVLGRCVASSSLAFSFS